MPDIAAHGSDIDENSCHPRRLMRRSRILRSRVGPARRLGWWARSARDAQIRLHRNQPRKKHKCSSKSDLCQEESCPSSTEHRDRHGLFHAPTLNPPLFVVFAGKHSMEGRLGGHTPRRRGYIFSTDCGSSAPRRVWGKDRPTSPKAEASPPHRH